MLVAKVQDIDLGNLKISIPKKFDFTLVNQSDKEIFVNRISVGCQACTQASMSSGGIKPGQTAKVNVTFTPGSTGINRKSLTIYYGGNHELILKFKSVVSK